MLIAYVDESGIPSFKENDNFVLSCIIIEDDHWSRLDKSIFQIKRKYYPKLNPDEIEFHASEIIRGRREHKTLTVQDRYKVLNEIYSLISQEELVILNVVINKSKIYNHKKATFDIEQWAYRLLFERLDKYSVKVNAKKKLTNKDDEYCIMIIDSHTESYDKKLRDKILNFLKHGTYYVQNKFIIEDPIFTDSKWRGLSQLVDCTAFCVGRVINKRGSNEQLTSIFETYYKLIEKKFDTDHTGRIEGCGLVIFPK